MANDIFVNILVDHVLRVMGHVERRDIRVYDKEYLPVRAVWVFRGKTCVAWNY